MLKRFFDFTICLFVFPFLLPLLCVIGMIVKFNSPGPVFYRGERTGLNGRTFRIFKFRTMVSNAESVGGPSTALNDPRITSIGRFLRKYKLDELPQLINILIGQMSFVGPRPQVKKYTDLYNEEEKIILTVKPGLTDYASVKFINLDQILGDDDVDDKYMKEIEPEKNRLRVQYAQEHSFFADLKIILMTVNNMLRIRSVWNSEN